MTALDTTRFALTHDAVATRVSDLPETLRLATESNESDVIWTQTRSRSSSFVVAADAADLLRGFDEPIGVAEAVVRFCAARNLDPKQVLRDAYPLLREAVDRRLLVSEGEWTATRSNPTLVAGQTVDRWTINRCIQSLTDSEVYEAHNDFGERVALKLARSADAARRQDRERRALSRLATIGPRLVGAGAIGETGYLAVEWIEGQSPAVIAEQLRSERDSERTRHMQLALAIVDAYWALHQKGFVHGDVHPLNLIVDRTGMVTLLDFEGASEIDAPNESRGYVAYYLEPEVARAMLEDRPVPPPSPKGEQFAVAALLFELFTGERYLDFRLQSERFLRQVCNEPPRSFASCGVRSWPALERLLARALSKNPSGRFENLAELAAMLRTVRDPRPLSSTRPHRRWLRRQLRDLSPGGIAFLRSNDQLPRSSVYLGLAGTALFHLRLADLRGDPDHLASADGCCARAEYVTSDPDAYTSPAMRDTPSTVSQAAFLHGPPGVALTRAMIGNARCDSDEVNRACRWFLHAARSRCANKDLTLGKSGVLFAAAGFLGLPSLATRERDKVLALGRNTFASLVHWAETVGGPSNRSRWRNLGMAHGWAGILFAMIIWSDADRATPLPEPMLHWLDALARRGERLGRLMRWPWIQDGNGRYQTLGYASGWCNGSAGFVHLWAAAHRVFGREEELRRMEGAAIETWSSDNSAWSLCCGTTGRAFAMLTAARVTGKSRWLSRARVLASRAVRLCETDLTREHHHSLFRGDAGLALLLAELEQPSLARFPLFETLK